MSKTTDLSQLVDAVLVSVPHVFVSELGSAVLALEGAWVGVTDVHVGSQIRALRQK